MAKKILVIDDDRLVLRTLTKYLKTCGYSVMTASSGIEALEKVGTSNLDLIISDIRMPGVSGIETIRRIREQIDNHKKNIPAIIITGYAGDENYHQDEALGITDYFYKPFEIDEFIKSVKKNLEPMPIYMRAHPRILVSFPITLKIKDSLVGIPSEILGETLDISEGGLSLVTIYKIPLDLEIKVFLDLSPQYSSLNVDARIVWSEARENGKYHYGLHFLDIENEHISVLREIFNKHKLLSEHFVSLSKQLKDFVQHLKHKFDEFDNGHFNNLERIDFLKNHKAEIFDKLSDYFTKIWEITKDFDRVRFIMHKDYFQQELRYLLLDPIEINKRIYEKPLGYPGDYQIMEYIYDYNGDKAYLGKTTYEKLINNYTCNIPISFSNIARKDLLKNKILEIIEKHKNPRIISLGCGSARELIEILNEGKINKKILFKCLDLELKTLKYIENAVDKISAEKKSFVTINYIHRDITGIIRDKKLREEIKEKNLIYLSGVYDYLSDKMAERIVKELYDLLEKDGELIICNISLENNSHRAYYELLGEWCMIHRTKNDILAWTNKLEGAHLEFVYPPKGDRYHFLIIKK